MTENNGIRTEQITAQHMFNRCKIEGYDKCANPYQGCSIGCRYCFASGCFKNFTGHSQDVWGSYAYPKYYKDRNVSDLSGKRVVIGSVTDPYNQCEAEYHRTRGILEDLPHDVLPTICTKSDLILSDRFLLSRIPNLTVCVSICSLDADFNAYMEPGAPSAERRLATLKSLHEAGVRTCLVISPIFPHITDVKALLDASQGSVDEVRFESLCLNDSMIRRRILDDIRSKYPRYYSNYVRIFVEHDSSYWRGLEREINELSRQYGVPFEICFNRSMRTQEEPRRIRGIAARQNEIQPQNADDARSRTVRATRNDHEEGRLTRAEWEAICEQEGRYTWNEWWNIYVESAYDNGYYDD